MSHDDNLSDRLINDIFHHGRNVFISGSGGTGKSYLIANHIKTTAERMKLRIAITSTTGVSALAIGGCTIHRWSGIKLGKESVLTIVNRILTKNKDCLKRWRETDILSIDEVSMLGMNTFQLIDKVGRNIRGINKPFGGLRLIFTGDFLQLPPVNDNFMFLSPLWNDLNLSYYKLTKPRRFPDEDHFQLLQRARTGNLTPDDIKKLKQRVTSYIDYIGNGGERKDHIKPTRIFSLKKDVEAHNMEELNKLQAETIIYKCIDTIICKGKDDKLRETEKEDYKEYFDTIIPHTLVFKPGAQVMLTYNLDTDNGLVNGSRGVVLECNHDGLLVKFRNGHAEIIRHNENEFEDHRVLMIRKQVPLILAWGISIHKSQGATLDYAIMDLGSTIFSAGMGYVGLSRVKTLEGVFLSNFNPKKIYADKDALEFEGLMDEMIKVEGEDNENSEPEGVKQNDEKYNKVKVELDESEVEEEPGEENDTTTE